MEKPKTSTHGVRGVRTFSHLCMTEVGVKTFWGVLRHFAARTMTLVTNMMDLVMENK